MGCEFEAWGLILTCGHGSEGLDAALRGLERAEGQFPTVFLSGPPWGLGVGQEWCCPPLPGSPPPLGTSGKVGVIWCLFSTWAALDGLQPCKAIWGGGGAAGAQCLGLGLTTPSAFVGDSGGHFNPAVSLAAMLVGGLHLMMLLPYWISQLCGGLIGAALAKVGDPPGGCAGGFCSDGAAGVGEGQGMGTVQFFLKKLID